MLATLVNAVQRFVGPTVQAIRTRVSHWMKPVNSALVPSTAADLTRSKAELMAENLLLRQQLIVLRRSVKRPTLTRTDRALLVLLASKVRTWKHALLIVKPETVLRWHRQGFRLFWKQTSTAKSRQPKVPAETVGLIQELATSNLLWGAERIRGELLKLGIPVSKRTIQKYLRSVRPPRRSGQTWATFLHNHAKDIWACDFLQVTDLFFRPLFAFFIMELASRRVVHVGVTRAPTDAWVAQQLREATPFGTAPTYLIHDHDSKFGVHFAQVAAGSGITVLKTPFRAPRANAICERFFGSVRRECLDHLLILSEPHLRRVLKEYSAYYNHARPHQGIAQRIPEPLEAMDTSSGAESRVIACPVLGGLHHAYYRAA
jgi:putative transposase